MAAQTLKEINMELQRALNAKGANLVVDGIIGPRTNEALALYNTSVKSNQVVPPGNNGIMVGGTPDVTPLPEIYQNGAPVLPTVVPDNGSMTYTNITSTNNAPDNSSEKTKLANEITKTKDEIAAIEERLNSVSSNRESSLNSMGVYDDLRRLDELNATLREAQDRQIEIPLEAKQSLRGRQATKQDFANETAPELEKAALKELVASRQATRMSDQIKTSLSIISSKFDQQEKADQFMYESKGKYLDTLQVAYSDILSDEQAAGLEYAKSLLSVESTLNKEFNADRKEIYDQLVKDGDWEGIGELAGVTDAASLTTFLQNKGIKTMTDNAIKRADEAVGVVNQIDEIMGTKYKKNVGPLGGRLIGFLGGADFKTKLDAFTATKTVDTLLAIKAQGGTFGALSEKELELLQNGATGLRRTGAGGVKMTEKAFEELMGTYKTAAMKTYIASTIGKEAAEKMGLKFMTGPEVEAMYKQKYAESLEATNNGNYFPTPESNIQGNELGNIPQRNNNPGNVKEGGLDAVQKLATGIDSQGHLVFPDAESGFRALALDLEAKLTGNSRYLPANPTIAQLGKVYAEDPAWGRSVASILGVPVSTPTTLVPFENLIYAISKQEGFFA